jgi:hypothetical protein
VVQLLLQPSDVQAARITVAVEAIHEQVSTAKMTRNGILLKPLIGSPPDTRVTGPDCK